MLDQGRVIEFGTPFELFNKSGGAFRNLCNESGDFDMIKQVSLVSHHKTAATDVSRPS